VTEYGSFEYAVTHSQVVQPDAVSVLRSTDRPTLVLTACTPRFSAAQRLVVFADRTAGPATGPSVRVEGTGPGDLVGPDDDVVRPMLLWLAVSFATGAMYLVVRARRGYPRPV
jgi:hypothetical protein